MQWAHSVIVRESRRSGIPRAPVINREAAAYWIPRFRGYDGVLMGEAASYATRVSRCRPKILRLQFDWRTVRRAIGGVIPGIAIAVQGIGCRDALGGDHSLQRRQPMPVIGLAGVGITLCLRAFDFVGKRLGPFVPGE